MKYAAIAAIIFTSPAWGASADEALSDQVVRSGEVIGVRTYMQPTFGFELLIRHNGGLFLCNVAQDSRFGYNGQPDIEYVAIKGCISERE